MPVIHTDAPESYDLSATKTIKILKELRGGRLREVEVPLDNFHMQAGRYKTGGYYTLSSLILPQRRNKMKSIAPFDLLEKILIAVYDADGKVDSSVLEAIIKSFKGLDLRPGYHNYVKKTTKDGKNVYDIVATILYPEKVAELETGKIDPDFIKVFKVSDSEIREYWVESGISEIFFDVLYGNR